MGDSLSNQLADVVRACIADVNEDREVSPALLASKAMARLDPDSISPPLVQWGCNLELRQIARKLLQREYDPITHVDLAAQAGLFDGLQQRYPCKRAADFVYVQRDDMTLEERRFNSGRLRACGLALGKHADALDTETDALVAEGRFEVGNQVDNVAARDIKKD